MTNWELSLSLSPCAMAEHCPFSGLLMRARVAEMGRVPQHRVAETGESATASMGGREVRDQLAQPAGAPSPSTKDESPAPSIRLSPCREARTVPASARQRAAAASVRGGQEASPAWRLPGAEPGRAGGRPSHGDPQPRSGPWRGKQPQPGSHRSPQLPRPPPRAERPAQPSHLPPLRELPGQAVLRRGEGGGGQQHQQPSC